MRKRLQNVIVTIALFEAFQAESFTFFLWLYR